MLQSLSIRNFALIERLDLEFGPGLNVLTGETGTGKSIILGALNLLLGGRADAEMVRTGAEKATLDAVFDLSRAPRTREALAEQGIDLDGDDLLLTREIVCGGKSTARIGGRPATVGQLKSAGEWLVDLHGQHEHQSLLQVARHLDFLDQWGGEETLDLRDEVRRRYRRLKELQEEKESLARDERERTQLLDLLGFQVKEIRDADLQPGEEEELTAALTRLTHAEKLAQATQNMAEALRGDQGALDRIGATQRGLEEAAGIDASLQEALDQVREGAALLEDASASLRRYAEGLEVDPELQKEIEDRLETIRRLKRKYGETIDAILSFAQEAETRLDRLQRADAQGAQLDSLIAEEQERLVEACRRLTALRRQLGARFAIEVQEHVRELAMDRGQFEVSIRPGDPGPTGADEVEFLFSANAGEALRPLVKVASGGEISRLMLAIKSALASQESLPTMVFDEIDAGVGGRTASLLGDKMSRLAKGSQIVCITHLAQIACLANRHFVIRKEEVNGRTLSQVDCLDPAARIDELARMIGGPVVTEAARRHAQELLGVA